MKICLAFVGTLAKSVRLGSAAFSLALAMLCAGVLQAADFTVSTPTAMSADQSAIYYDNVYVNADLTIDGTDRGLTNGSSIVIGGGASAPVTVVVTNGAKWVVKERKAITMSGKGGTFIVSSPTAPVFSGGSAESMVIGNVNPNHLGTVGYYTDVVIDGTVSAAGGVLDIARLLTNGTVSFRQVKNTNPDVAARLLFEGGVHWLSNDDSTTKNRFRTENGSRIVLESVDGNPIFLRSTAQNYTLFTGTGTLETAGAGDFIMRHGNKAENTGVIKLSVDEGGKIVWGHGGRTVLKDTGIWRVLTDDVLPFGSQTGPVVFSPAWSSAATIPSAILDLNGKTATVNALLTEGTYAARNVVTNSSETVASLRLNVETNAVLSGLIGANVKFAANAATNIRLQKTGAGTLTVDTMPTVAGFDVLEGAVVGTANVAVENVTATNGATLMVKAPYYDGFNSKQGFRSGVLAVGAGEGTAVLSNVWQNALVVRSGTASIENGAERIAPAERAGRPVRSQIGAVSVDGGVLDIARGCLSSTNITVAAGRRLHIGGGAGLTNRVEFYTPELTDRYYRFVFKAVNGGAFGLNCLFLRTKDGSDEFSAKSAGGVNQYTLDESAATASDLAPGKYMFSCPNGLVFTMGNGGNKFCTYAKDGLTSVYGWGGVRINDGTTPSLANPNTWVTLTIRLRNEVAMPIVGYTLRQSMAEKRLAAWEVQASADGMSWRTVDEGTVADIYEYSHDNAGYYGWFNNGEPFSWRCLAAGNAFNCAGFVQVDEGGVLDLNCVPDANISIKGLTVDATIGGGAIVKFRPATDGVLNIIGLGGELPAKYTSSVTLAEVVDAANFNSWRVTLDGTVVRGSRVTFANGALTAHLTSGFVLIVR